MKQDRRDEFTSHIFAWLRQVFADRELPATAFKLAFAVSQYVNSKTRKAWPSLPTLASDVDIDRRTGIRLIARLEAHGHLQVERHRIRGRNRSNTYRLNIKKGDTGDTFSDEENVSLASPFQDEKGDIQRKKTCHPAHEKVTPVSPEPSSEPSEDIGGESAAFRRRAADAAPPEEEEGFAEFWQHYPKRQGEHGARRAFAEAMAAGVGPKDIIAGAMRYGAASIGKSDQWVAMPANWLRDRRWKDEPSPNPDNVRGERGDGGRRRRDKPSLAEEMLRAGGHDVGGRE
jgi:hypothetical protein